MVPVRRIVLGEKDKNLHDREQSGREMSDRTSHRESEGLKVHRC